MSALPDPAPLFKTMLVGLVGKGSVRCNDGGMVDTLCSSLCSFPTYPDAYARWELNPKWREDGYMSIYFPTELGIRYVKEMQK